MGIHFLGYKRLFWNKKNHKAFWEIKKLLPGYKMLFWDTKLFLTFGTVASGKGRRVNGRWPQSSSSKSSSKTRSKSNTNSSKSSTKNRKSSISSSENNSKPQKRQPKQHKHFGRLKAARVGVHDRGPKTAKTGKSSPKTAKTIQTFWKVKSSSGKGVEPSAAPKQQQKQEQHRQQSSGKSCGKHF